MVRSHLRFAAGVCVLAAGLLMGGGAVAVAVPGLGGSAPNGDDGTNDSVQGGPTAGGPVGNVTDTVRQTIQGVAGTPGSAAQPGQQPSTGPTSTLGSGRQPGQQPSTGAKSPKTRGWRHGHRGPDERRGPRRRGLPIRSPRFPTRWPGSRAVAPVSDVVALLQECSRRLPMRSRRFTDAVAPLLLLGGIAGVAPVPNLVAPVSDVIASVQDMLTSVAGAVVPLTQLPSDLSSFLLGIAGVPPVVDGVGGIHGAGLVGTRGCVGGVAIAAGPALCRCLGRAGGRQRNQGCNARCDCARSSVSAVRDGTASAQWRLSDGCGVVFPACFRRTPANRFTVGAGRCRSARHRRACDPYRSRGAHPIRQANAGFASRTSGIAGFAHPAGR